MPVSHKYKAVFVHIPRTGGGSIEHALGIYGSDNNGSNVQDNNILYGHSGNANKALQHLTALEIRDFIGAEQYGSYLKFAVIRNPFDKIVSEYYWQKHFGLNISFNDFLNRQVPQNIKTGKHYLEQWKFISDKSGQVIIDHIARYETYTSDIQHIFKILGVNNSLSVKHRVKSAEFGHYTDYFNEENRNQLKSLYKQDIDMFSYSLIDSNRK